MCGIAGIWSRSLRTDERRLLVRQLLAGLADRGPDCSVIVDDVDFSLGFCRLTITGAGGVSQPVRCRHILTATNGEIYNYQSLWTGLPAELRSTPKPVTDSVVVAPLAVMHGSDFVDQLDGAYAGVVMDTARGSLTLFRDHVGVKPMHYVQLKHGMAFASTASALVPITGGELNTTVLSSYLADGYARGDETLIKGIGSVPAGCTLTWTDCCRDPKVRRWFEPERSEQRASVRDTVTAAIRSELPEAGPTVTTLSGGIDSTLVTLVAARERTDTTGLTVSFTGAPPDPDAAFAARVVSDHGLRHQYVRVGPNDYLTELADGWRFDQPLADPNAIALNRLSRRAGELGSRVLLVGDGADELFCGYPYYRDVAGARLRHRLAAWRFSSMTDERDRQFASSVTGRRLRRPLRPSRGNPMVIAQRRDLADWLEPNLLTKADRMGMANQVEIRPPLVRRAVVSLALGLPVDQKFDPASGVGKVALRQAFSDILPGYVLDRPKQGFPCPLTPWLRADLGHALRAEATWSIDDAWDVTEERRLWEQHLVGRADWAQQLWRLAVLRSWWQRVTAVRGQISAGQFTPAVAAEERGLPC